MELLKIMKCCILGAVINKHDFVIIAAAIKGGQNRILERSYILCFVIARDNKGQLHGNHLKMNVTLLYVCQFRLSRQF